MGAGKSGLRASSDAAAQMTTRIAVVVSARATPRTVCLLSRDLLDLGTNGLRYLAHDANHAGIPGAARARDVHDDFAQDPSGTCTDEHDAITKAHGLVDLMRDEHHRRPRRTRD